MRPQLAWRSPTTAVQAALSVTLPRESDVFRTYIGSRNLRRPSTPTSALPPTACSSGRRRAAASPSIQNGRLIYEYNMMLIENYQARTGPIPRRQAPDRRRHEDRRTRRAG